MKKRISFLFLMIGIPVMAQVELEVDAVKPRTITASEIPETVIDYGEIVVDIDSGTLTVGNGSAGGKEIASTNTVLKTGSTITGDTVLSGDAKMYIGTNGLYMWSTDQQDYYRILYDNGSAGYPYIENVYRITMFNTVFENGSISYDGSSAFGIEERKLYDENGLEVITFAAGINIYTSINMNGNAIEDVSALYLSGTNAITDDGANLLRNGVAIGSGSTITNIGFGLTGNGDETALAVDTSLVATGTPLYAYTETDPEWASWLGNNFTGAVEALVESIAVTGAVTSINGEDGAVTIAITGAGVTTNSTTSWTIAAGGSGFPLTNNGDLAGFSLTNGAFVGDGNLLTNLPITQTTVNGEDGGITFNAGAGLVFSRVGKTMSYAWEGTTNAYQYWTREDGTNVLVTSDGTDIQKQYFSTNDLPIEPVPIAVEAGLLNINSGPGEYALMRTVSPEGVTNTAWRIVRGQLANSLNASFKWTSYGVANKFYANGTNEQTYTIPAGITQIVIKCFGAGGTKADSFYVGGTGGSTIQPYVVIPGEVLTLRVGTSIPHSGGTLLYGGWPGGGNGYTAHATYPAAGGGGYSGVFMGTNIIAIAGGGGGGSYYAAGGRGGGSAGEAGIYHGSGPGGGGGTQTGGGAGIVAGGYLQGGSNPASGLNASGGGGGYYGGGTGYSNLGAGGGGSGYVSTPFGYTYQGVLTGDANYESGIGVAGGNGMIVILHDAPTEE